MKKILVVAGLLVPILLFSQQPDRLSLSYFAESAIHPGLKAGAEWTLGSSTKEKSRWFKKRRQKIGAKVIQHDLILASSLGGYHFPNNHNGWFLQAELGWRKSWTRKGRFIGAGLGAGALYRAYNIPVYSLETGAEPGSGGYTQFTPLVTMSYGRTLENIMGLPVSWFIKPVFTVGIPQAHTIVPNAGLELGILYHL